MLKNSSKQYSNQDRSGGAYPYYSASTGTASPTVVPAGATTAQTSAQSSTSAPQLINTADVQQQQQQQQQHNPYYTQYWAGQHQVLIKNAVKNGNTCIET